MALKEAVTKKASTIVIKLLCFCSMVGCLLGLGEESPREYTP